MDVDPIDFFPGCDPYYLRRTRRSSSSCCKTVCTHFMVMLLSFGICVAMIYYYENYYKPLGFMNNSLPKEPIKDKYVEKLIKEVEKINDSLHQMNIWRMQMDMFIVQKYTKQEINFDKKIQNAIDTYDCDKLGMYDYASIYGGGSIIALPDTMPFPANKTISFFNLLAYDLFSNPEAMLQPSNFPGNCFAFYGATGRIRIKLGKKIKIQSVTMEHSLYTDDCRSAPRDFKVYGLLDANDKNGILLGQFSYKIQGRPYQTFIINKNLTVGLFEYVELQILNNHGKDFTCIYRFRVHSTSTPKCTCEHAERNTNILF